MEYAKLVVVTPPKAKWYIRVKLFFTFFRILPSWIGDKITAKKYLHLKFKKHPTGRIINITH